MSIQGLPPFHLPAGEDEEGNPTLDLYALAFVRGEYVGPGGGTAGEECFSVIYLAPPVARWPFCLLSITEAGYSLNICNPDVRNIDQMLMWAWDENEVHPAEWALYCEEAEGAAERIADPSARQFYLAAAGDAAETVEMFLIRRLAHAAGKAFAEKRGRPAKLLPLFRFKSGR